MYRIIVTTTFGLEALVKRELMDLGYENISVENGRVRFVGDKEDIARCNLWWSSLRPFPHRRTG